MICLKFGRNLSTRIWVRYDLPLPVLPDNSMRFELFFVLSKSKTLRLGNLSDTNSCMIAYGF